MRAKGNQLGPEIRSGIETISIRSKVAPVVLLCYQLCQALYPWMVVWPGSWIR